MKKILLILLSLVFILSIATGCGKEKTAKDIVLDGLEKQKTIESESFAGQMKLDFDFSNVNATSEEIAMMQMFPGMELTFDGKETLDPLQFEMNLNLKIQGMSFDMPMFMKDNILYIKLPAYFLMFLPDPTVEYISMDLSETYAEYDAKAELEKSAEVMKAIVNSIEDKAFAKEDAKNYTIENVEVSDVVSFNITQENLKPVLQSIVKEALPYFLEQIDKYSATPEQKEQMDLLKAELEQEKIDQFINDIDQYLIINQFKTTSVYDKDGYERKAIVDADVIITAEEIGELGLKMNIDYTIKSINEELQFEMEIPSKDKVLDLEELAEMGAGF